MKEETPTEKAKKGFTGLQKTIAGLIGGGLLVAAGYFVSADKSTPTNPAGDKPAGTEDTSDKNPNINKPSSNQKNNIATPSERSNKIQKKVTDNKLYEVELQHCDSPDDKACSIGGRTLRALEDYNMRTAKAVLRVGLTGAGFTPVQVTRATTAIGGLYEKDYSITKIDLDGNIFIYSTEKDGKKYTNKLNLVTKEYSYTKDN
ncbi:MAG: hypothetical protein KDK45_12280 [Leptospiraceae bacterium]|nr:hypothetical protein [Leptospiraceae bacterium]